MDSLEKNDTALSPEEPQDTSPITKESHKRKRLSHACGNCRAKKKRCDGGNPCSPCVADYLQCSYGFAIPSQGKSDTILKMVIQNNELVQKVLDEIQSCKSNDINRGFKLAESTPSFTPSARAPAIQDAINNAAITSRHRSGAYFMLQWSIFDDCIGLRENIRSTLVLEAERAPLQLSPSIRYPYVTSNEVDRIIDIFQQNVNFWMPTISLERIEKLRRIVLTGQSDLSSEVCLAMLVMALGLACESVECRLPLRHGSGIGELSGHRLQMSFLYFDAASRASSIAQMEMTPTIYLTFLQRPAQAWTMLDSTAMKCRLILDHLKGSTSAEERESVKRIFWSCFLIESDLLVELSGIPESRIGIVESSIPPLGSMKTHVSDQTCSDALEYFLACIAIRRLLNRSHHFLYSQNIPVYNQHTPTLISELRSQLYSWWECLPPSLKFEIEVDEDGLYYSNVHPQNNIQAYLRTRFLACQVVISRPYLMDAGFGTDLVPRPTTFQEVSIERQQLLQRSIKAYMTLGMTTLQLPHTFIVSAWVSSCSAISSMLMFLAAERLLGPQLSYLREQILEVSQKLVRFCNLLKDFHKDSGISLYNESPSMAQNCRLIEHIYGLLIRDVYLPPLFPESEDVDEIAEKVVGSGE
ncbi:hypothetical protein F5884DRAFT_848371 [Xylogone sp. PMI_703]|nr:hypothetical protein F5884DRAFT_848371 [Xylogone sp. PMI_703]